MIKYIIKKIKSRIINQDLHKVNNYIINNEMSNVYHNFKNIIKDMMNTNNGEEFFDISKELYNVIIDYSLFLMDMYTIRRIIDKSYVSNCILYVGGEHAIHYILLLMNILNFQLINAAKYNASSLDDLRNNIRKCKYHYELKKYFTDEFMFDQCCDYSSFPIFNSVQSQ